MKVERVFRKVPPDELVLRILKAIGVVSFQDAHWWSYNMLIVPTVVDKLEKLIKELHPYYMPHKCEIVNRNQTPRRILTILRHIVRAKGMDLEGHEVHSSNLTYNQRMLYRLVNPIPNETKTDAIFTVEFP
jgi:hypothetical protein